MKRTDRHIPAFREAFFAGRLGIRAKILIYLTIYAGFMISLVWLFQNALMIAMSHGFPIRMSRELTPEELMRWHLLLMVVTTLLATGLVGFTMAKSISEPLIETNRAARELRWSRYARPVHSGGYREIAELNDTLVQTAEELGRVEDLQRELIANISHDLRTPLTMIQGYAEAMRDIPDEMTPGNMQIIIDETERLSSMVNEVLDFSRLRTGNLELNRTDFCLTDLIR